MRLMRAPLVSLALVAWGAQAADSYPNRPVRVIIPFPPGGNVDTFARVLYRHVEQDLGQPIILDNRGGANSILGSDIVAKASPDGYTYLNTSFGFAVNAAIVRKLPFDVEKDFLPVTNVALGDGYLMVVNAAVPAKNVKELIALAKQKPLRYSTAGVGNGQHLAGALFAERAGVEMASPDRSGSPRCRTCPRWPRQACRVTSQTRAGTQCSPLRRHRCRSSIACTRPFARRSTCRKCASTSRAAATSRRARRPRNGANSSGRT
jgi:hypothetical protein